MRCRVSGRMRAAWSIAAVASRGMKAPWIDRRAAQTCSPRGRATSAVEDQDRQRTAAREDLGRLPSGSPGRSPGDCPGRWDPGTNRVAPLSGLNTSIMTMKPRSGHPSASHCTSTWSGCAGAPGSSVLASIVLSLTGRPMTSQQAARMADGRRTRRTPALDSRSRAPALTIQSRHRPDRHGDRAIVGIGQARRSARDGRARNDDEAGIPKLGAGCFRQS